VRAFEAVARTTFGHPNGTASLDFAGRTDVSIVREFFTKHGIDPTPANFERFLDDYVFWLDHFLGRSSGRVLPGVWDLIRALRRLPEPPVSGLLTGNIRLGAELKLRHYGLWEEFELGAFSDDGEDRNELAALAHRRGNVLAGRDLDGDEVLVIGDTPRDVACAEAIGARCLAVATGGTPLETLRRTGATWVAASLAEVNAEEISGAGDAAAGRRGFPGGRRAAVR
jgi:phosphoglycolate phosphatase-like HAD superfamily hydrolase